LLFGVTILLLLWDYTKCFLPHVVHKCSLDCMSSSSQMVHLCAHRCLTSQYPAYWESNPDLSHTLYYVKEAVWNCRHICSNRESDMHHDDIRDLLDGISMHGIRDQADHHRDDKSHCRRCIASTVDSHLHDADLGWIDGDSRWHDGDSHLHEGDSHWHEGDSHWHEGDSHWHDGDSSWPEDDSRWSDGNSRWNDGDSYSREDDSHHDDSDFRNLVQLINDDKGACSSSQDYKKLKSSKFSKNILHTCARSCLASPHGISDCVKECAMSNLGITDSCAKCFGDNAWCSVRYCTIQCSRDPEGDSCTSCLKSNCWDDLKKCSGLDVEEYIGIHDEHQKGIFLHHVVNEEYHLCSNWNDYHILFNPESHSHVAHSLHECHHQCQSSFSEHYCLQRCLNSTLLISHECSGCIGQSLTCVHNFCHEHCGPNEMDVPSCRGCIHTHCESHFKDCSGVPLHHLADFFTRIGDVVETELSLSQDYCSNYKDKQKLQDSTKVLDAVNVCSNQCMQKIPNGYSKCVSQCMQDELGLSDKCSFCYGSIFKCAITSCSNNCRSNPGSPECKRCTLQNCAESFTSCKNALPWGVTRY